MHIKHSDYTLYPKSVLHCLFYLHFGQARWLCLGPCWDVGFFRRDSGFIVFPCFSWCSTHHHGSVRHWWFESPRFTWTDWYILKTPTLNKVIRTRSPWTLFHCCASPWAGSSCGLGSWVAKAIVFIFQIGESVCWSAWNSTDADDCNGWKEGRNTVNGVPTVLQ